MMPNIHFDPATETMEMSLSGLRLHTNTEIGRLYDGIEDKITESGRAHWYFLVEMGDIHVNPAVWSYWASRGRLLNLGHSLGTVRYAASPECQSRLEAAAKAEGFDPNLCCTRDDALARLKDLRANATDRAQPEPSLSFHQLFDRLTFDHSARIMDLDLSGLVLRSHADVNYICDHVETRILCMAPQLRWYFLVNYENVQIAPSVESQFAQRGRSLNQRYSLGTARYGMPMPLTDQIHMRAESRNFDPNVFATREDALAHLHSLAESA